ncbi:MAG: radical SAM protein [Candidatus Diapherotrites archaeon]
MGFVQGVSLFGGIIKCNLFGARIPLNAGFSITNKCNSKCIYCNIPERKIKDLSTGQVLEVIEVLSKKGTKRIGFTGGEPLLRKDIGEIIDFARKKGIFTTLGSNGILAEKRIDELKNLNLLVLSLDGSKKIHDMQRGIKCYEKVVGAIKKARENGIKVWTVTTLTKYNLNEIDFILEKAQELNFWASFQPLHHNPRLSGKTEKIRPSEKEYKNVVKKLIEAKIERKKVANSMQYLKHLLYWPDSSKAIKCLAGRQFCHIDSNEDIFPCFNSMEKFNALNFFENGFEKAFEKLSGLNCGSCLSANCMEYNFIGSMNLGALMNLAGKNF